MSVVMPRTRATARARRTSGPDRWLESPPSPVSRLRRSSPESTCGRLTPGVFGRSRTAPVATTTAPGRNAATIAGVAVVAVRTSTPASARAAAIHRTRSPFSGVVSDEKRAVPPRWLALSSRVTLWPRSAATRAASMPPGPPPTTTT